MNSINTSISAGTAIKTAPQRNITMLLGGPINLDVASKDDLLAGETPELNTKANGYRMRIQTPSAMVYLHGNGLSHHDSMMGAFRRNFEMSTKLHDVQLEHSLISTEAKRKLQGIGVGTYFEFYELTDGQVFGAASNEDIAYLLREIMLENVAAPNTAHQEAIKSFAELPSSPVMETAEAPVVRETAEEASKVFIGSAV